MSSDSPSSFNGPPSPRYPNSKLMVAAVVVLFAVVFFILILHVYAKWFWRNNPRRRSVVSRRHRRHFEFAGEDSAGGHRSSSGLDKSIVDLLPVFSYKPPASEEEPLLECAVCLCEFEENEKGRLLPNCKHSFHTQCIDMWFHSHVTCPLCRTVVTTFETPSKMQEDDMSDRGSSSPLPLLRNGSNSHIPVAQTNGTFPPHLPYPSDVLFWGSFNHGSFQLSSPSIGSGSSSSTRSLPLSSIEIPRRLEGFLASRGTSLSMSRCPSADIEQECSSQVLKSSSIRVSIRRLLSREKSRGRMRVAPSGDEERGELEAEADFTGVQVV